jgi:regulator of protease activity HflC (stomatin/prohibitin superfamily)
MNPIISCVGTILILYIGLMLFGFHKVREGYVGIYKYFGVLDEKLTEPGIHFLIPFYQ